jgi:hypothetical protein
MIYARSIITHNLIVIDTIGIMIQQKFVC